MKSVDLVNLLYSALEETINKGLSNDEITKKIFNEKDLQELENNYRLYGYIFGLNYIETIVGKLDNLSKEIEENKNKEDKEN